MGRTWFIWYSSPLFPQFPPPLSLLKSLMYTSLYQLSGLGSRLVRSSVVVVDGEMQNLIDLHEGEAKLEIEPLGLEFAWA